MSLSPTQEPSLITEFKSPETGRQEDSSNARLKNLISNIFSLHSPTNNNNQGPSYNNEGLALRVMSYICPTPIDLAEQALSKGDLKELIQIVDGLKIKDPAFETVKVMLLTHVYDKEVNPELLSGILKILDKMDLTDHEKMGLYFKALQRTDLQLMDILLDHFKEPPPNFCFLEASKQNSAKKLVYFIEKSQEITEDQAKKIFRSLLRNDKMTGVDKVLEHKKIIPHIRHYAIDLFMDAVTEFKTNPEKLRDLLKSENIFNAIPNDVINNEFYFLTQVEKPNMELISTIWETGRVSNKRLAFAIAKRACLEGLNLTNILNGFAFFLTSTGNLAFDLYARNNPLLAPAEANLLKQINCLASNVSPQTKKQISDWLKSNIPALVPWEFVGASHPNIILLQDIVHLLAHPSQDSNSRSRSFADSGYAEILVKMGGEKPTSEQTLLCYIAGKYPIELIKELIEDEESKCIDLESVFETLIAMPIENAPEIAQIILNTGRISEKSLEIAFSLLLSQLKKNVKGGLRWLKIFPHTSKLKDIINNEIRAYRGKEFGELLLSVYGEKNTDSDTEQETSSETKDGSQ